MPCHSPASSAVRLTRRPRAPTCAFAATPESLPRLERRQHRGRPGRRAGPGSPSGHHPICATRRIRDSWATPEQRTPAVLDHSVLIQPRWLSCVGDRSPDPSSATRHSTDRLPRRRMLRDPLVSPTRRSRGGTTRRVFAAAIASPRSGTRPASDLTVQNVKGVSRDSLRDDSPSRPASDREL